MHSKALLTAVALVAFDVGVSLAMPALPQTNAVPTITRQIDCIEWGTPESCDIFCFATLCAGLPATLTHMTDREMQNDNRKNSGANLGPFTDAGIAKYGTWRRGDDYTWGDEYPLASSHQGGNGVANSGQAIVQGARGDEQRSQAQWAKRIWEGIPEAGAVTISVNNWDSARSPYCDDWKARDESNCKGSPYYGGNSPYFRLDAGNNGPNGAKTLSQLGI